MLGFKSFWSARILTGGIETMHLICKGQIGHNPSRTTSHIEHPRLKGKRLLKVRGQAADSGLVPMRNCGCVLELWSTVCASMNGVFVV